MYASCDLSGTSFPSITFQHLYKNLADENPLFFLPVLYKSSTILLTFSEVPRLSLLSSSLSIKSDDNNVLVITVVPHVEDTITSMQMQLLSLLHK